MGADPRATALDTAMEDLFRETPSLAGAAREFVRMAAERAVAGKPFDFGSENIPWEASLGWWDRANYWAARRQGYSSSELAATAGRLDIEGMRISDLLQLAGRAAGNVTGREAMFGMQGAGAGAPTQAPITINVYHTTNNENVASQYRYGEERPRGQLGTDWDLPGVQP
ncbi:MAG: hypothetical protein IPM64_06225 [Phycisphaerales bacterium]|nr:hypothetical protein [Phycisphaerales bacterium]